MERYRYTTKRPRSWLVIEKSWFVIPLNTHLRLLINWSQHAYYYLIDLLILTRGEGRSSTADLYYYVFIIVYVSFLLSNIPMNYCLVIGELRRWMYFLACVLKHPNFRGLRSFVEILNRCRRPLVFKYHWNHIIYESMRDKLILNRMKKMSNMQQIFLAASSRWFYRKIVQ